MAGLRFLVPPIGVRIPVPEKNKRPRDVCFYLHTQLTPPIGVALILRAISVTSLGYAKLSLFTSLITFPRPNPCLKDKQASS